MLLRSITFIKTVHTIAFVLLSGLLAVFLYEVLFNRVTFISWLAVFIFLLEGLALMLSGWRCPLTVYAESLGSNHGQVTDLFLPKWCADQVFYVYGAAFGLGLVMFLIRVLGVRSGNLFG